MDKVSLQRIDLAHPIVRDDLRKILEECDKKLTGRYKLRYTHTLRTYQQQADLFAQGRNRPGPVVTWAMPGHSWHNYGLAVDICLYDEANKMAVWDEKSDFDQDGKSDWMECVEVFKSYGWEWGGDWPKNKRDNPHFQKTFGLSIAQAIAQKTQYIDVT